MGNQCTLFEESVLSWQPPSLGREGDGTQAFRPALNSEFLVVGICSESNCKWKTHFWPRRQESHPANPANVLQKLWPQEAGVGLLPKICAAVKVAGMGLGSVTVQLFGNDLGTSPT